MEIVELMNFVAVSVLHVIGQSLMLADLEVPSMILR